MKKLLIVDDDVHIGDMLQEALTHEGYGVARAYSGTEALYCIKEEKPDLILLDLMLPGFSGEEVIKQISSIPVIVVSAKVGVDDKVNLLVNGAVDYVTKPFHLKELIARIEVQFRREAVIKTDLITYDDIVIDAKLHEVRVADELVALTRTEYAILKLLVQNGTNVISKSRILDEIFEDTPDCTESSLKTHISHLRNKLREKGGKEYIEAIWGIGFRMTNVQ